MSKWGEEAWNQNARVLRRQRGKKTFLGNKNQSDNYLLCTNYNSPGTAPRPEGIRTLELSKSPRELVLLFYQYRT